MYFMLLNELRKLREELENDTLSDKEKLMTFKRKLTRLIKKHEKKQRCNI